MRISSRRLGVLAGAVALLVGLTVISPAVAAPVARFDAYPTWDQVAAAKGNEAATAATISTINTLLGQLQSDAARLGDAAVKRAAEANTAKRDLTVAIATAVALQSQADAAAHSAERSTQRASVIVAALYRSGGTDLTGRILFSGGGSANLLYQLGALNKVGSQVDASLQQAELDRNQANALSAQAAVAKTERDRLSVAADAAAASAQAASDAANAAVASQQANLDLLYAQLADLKNTTAALEQAYQVGQQAGNDSGGSGGGGAGNGGGSIDVPAGDVNNPAAAKNFAYALIASYGMGSEQNDCILSLWNRESGWRTNAYNESSGAYGIPQSLPGSKMAIVGADWRTNYMTQVRWGMMYIVDRYDTPCGAWAHSEAIGWY
jgi:hypothetical protein